MIKPKNNPENPVGFFVTQKTQANPENPSEPRKPKRTQKTQANPLVVGLMSMPMFLSEKTLTKEKNLIITAY